MWENPNCKQADHKHQEVTEGRRWHLYASDIHTVIPFAFQEGSGQEGIKGVREKGTKEVIEEAWGEEEKGS